MKRFTFQLDVVYEDGTVERRDVTANTYTSAWRCAIKHWLHLENIRGLTLHRLEGVRS